MYNKNEARYFILIRLGAFCVSVFLWTLSVLWSAEGFGIKLEGWKVAGYGLALSVTVIQLIFNRGTMNPTLFFGGLAAYIYGIATNVIGLFNVMNVSIGLDQWKSDPLDLLFSTILIIALAFVVEVLPESLLLWAINPDQGSPGDFVSSLFQGSGLKRTKNNRQIRPNQSNIRTDRTEYFPVSPQNQTKRTNKTSFGAKQTKPFPYSINWNKLDKNTNIYRVLMFYRDYWGKTNRECPNKIVVKETRVSKGQVSSILADLKRGKFA